MNWRWFKRLLCAMDSHVVPAERAKWNGVFWEAVCPTCKRQVWFDQYEGWMRRKP